MEENKQLNDIILDKNTGNGKNKKVIMVAAILGVIFIIVIMLMNTLSSNDNKNLPKAVLPPKAQTKPINVVKEEPLFEDVEVIQEQPKTDDNLEHIAQKLKQESLMNTDINTLLEANISLFKMSNTIKLNLLTDTAMPNFKLDQAQLSKLIKKSLELFKNNDSIMITLKIVVGEYIIINKKKEKIIELSFEAKTRDKDDNALQNIANSNYIAIILKDNLIRLNIPFIQDKLK